MTKKAIRTPEQKKYRTDLANTIKNLRSQWKEWRNAAMDLYHTLKNNDEYKEAKEWVTIDQVFKDLADFLDKVKEKKPREKLEKIIGGEIHALFQMLQDDKLELTDEQNKLIKEIVLYWFGNHWTHFSNYEAWLHDGIWIGERNMSINILCANFKRFSQQDREEILSKIIDKVHKDYQIELYGQELEWSRSNNLWYYPNKYRFDVHYSFWTERYHGKTRISPRAIHPLIIETLQNSTNEKLIFEMFWYLKEYKKEEIPENCISEYSDMEKLKEYITPKILGSYGPGTKKTFEILESLWLTITWDVAEQRSKKVIHWYWDESVRGHSRYVDETHKINKLSEKVIQKDSVKQALNSIIENCKKEDLEKFKKYFSSEYIWKLLDDKYKKPEFVNKHIDTLKPILDEDWLDVLLQQFKKSTEWKDLSDSEKFHRDVFGSLSNVWKYVDLTSLEEDDFWNVKNGLYNFIEEEWLLGTPYLDNILKWHWYPKTHSVYYMLKAKWEVSKDFLKEVLNNDDYYNQILSSEEATAFMQDIYATQDDNLVKKLFDKIWKFSESCTQEEVNILTRKMIKAISSKEDFQKFYNMIERYAYSENFGIFLKIKYLLTGKLDDYELRKHKTEIPSDIYASLISSKIIDIGNKDLPKVWSSVFVDSDNLMKLSGYYDEMTEEKKKAEEEARQAEQERLERLKREKEETEKIYNEAIENREKWEVVFDKYKKNEIYGGQKYILSVDRKKHILKFATAPIDECGFHSDIHYKYIEEWRCLWWGFLDKDDENKIIRLRWYSQSYGSVDEKEEGIMKKMLEKKFPGYKVL